MLTASRTSGGGREGMKSKSFFLDRYNTTCDVLAGRVTVGGALGCFADKEEG